MLMGIEAKRHTEIDLMIGEFVEYGNRPGWKLPITLIYKRW
jgi:hypothetical protein